MDQDANWYGGKPRPRPHCVRRVPSPQKGPANFWLMSVMAKWLDELIKMPLGTEVGLGHGHNVLDEDPARAQFSAHVCCGQTAGRIKIPLGIEVGISPGDLVLDGDPAPPNKGHSPPPTFWPMYVLGKWLDGSRCHLVWR